MWEAIGPVGLFRHAISGLSLDATCLSSGDVARQWEEAYGAGAGALVPKRYRLSHRKNTAHLEPFGLALLRDDTFALRDAPTRLPSEHLDDLHTIGFTVLDNVMSQPMLDHLHELIKQRRSRPKHAAGEAKQRAGQDQRPYASFDNILGAGSFLPATPVVAQAAMNPVALHLIETYLGVDSIHYCHSPAITILRPAEKTVNPQVMPGGWHSDFPFPATCDPKTGKAARVTHTWPEEYDALNEQISAMVPSWRDRKTPLGVQFIVALSDFKDKTGSTQFVLGSHLHEEPPSVEMNAIPTVAGVGAHAEVVQVPCPAGSAVIYDSRTYHRACPELNVSGSERFAMLNCTTPSFVRDLSARNDKKASANDFAASLVLEALTLREAKDVIRMVGDDEFGKVRPEVEAAVLQAPAYSAVVGKTSKL
jgi:hypothetical protein